MALADGNVPQQTAEPGRRRMSMSISALAEEKARNYAPIQGPVAVSMRVFTCHAIPDPGVNYKSVLVSPQMTTDEVIRRLLLRLECDEDPRNFELHFAVVSRKKSTIRKIGSLMSLTSPINPNDKPHVLAEDECPVLVAEWFSMRPRRFELHRKRVPVAPIISAPKKAKEQQISSSRRWSTGQMLLPNTIRTSTHKLFDKLKTQPKSRSRTGSYSVGVPMRRPTASRLTIAEARTIPEDAVES